VALPVDHHRIAVRGPRGPDAWPQPAALPVDHRLVTQFAQQFGQFRAALQCRSSGPLTSINNFVLTLRLIWAGAVAQ
jgi:hypothetical protein